MSIELFQNRFFSFVWIETLRLELEVAASQTVNFLMACSLSLSCRFTISLVRRYICALAAVNTPSIA